MRLGSDLEPQGVTRDDVAAVLAAVLDEPRAVGRQWDLVGGDASVRDALEAAL